MASAPRELDRPAFYALRSGGWRDLVTLLHPPYTAWHLSYVAIGAAAAPHIYANRLIAALAAFFLAVGISAHALDELHGHPLATKLRPAAPARRDRHRAHPGRPVGAARGRTANTVDRGRAPRGRARGRPDLIARRAPRGATLVMPAPQELNSLGKYLF